MATIPNTRFNRETTDVARVFALRPFGSYSDEHFALPSGGASPVVECDGRVGVADHTIAALCGGTFGPHHGAAGFRFGPGGRRHYRYLTGKLLAEMVRDGSGWGRNEKSRRRAINVRAFCSDLAVLLEADEEQWMVAAEAIEAAEASATLPEPGARVRFYYAKKWRLGAVESASLAAVTVREDGSGSLREVRNFSRWQTVEAFRAERESFIEQCHAEGHFDDAQFEAEIEKLGEVA